MSCRFSHELTMFGDSVRAGDRPVRDPLLVSRRDPLLLQAALGLMMIFLFLPTTHGAAEHQQADSDRDLLRLDAESDGTTLSDEITSKIWKSSMGRGFRPGVRRVGVELGPALGMKVLGSSQEHDFVLARMQYGLMLDGAFQPEGSTLGNWEVIGEIFAGSQIKPDSAYLFGVAPLLRYHFNTRTRWVPFVDAGAGFSATDIGLPDQRTIFEFNVQGGAGFHYFLSEDTALTAQYRFLHLSNAGLKRPNLGVNTNVLYVGLNHFF